MNIRGWLKNFSKKIEQKELRAGEVLETVYCDPEEHYQKWGYKTFKAYVGQELGMSENRAFDYMAVYRFINDSGASDEELLKIGKAHMALIWRIAKDGFYKYYSDELHPAFDCANNRTVKAGKTGVLQYYKKYDKYPSLALIGAYMRKEDVDDVDNTDSKQNQLIVRGTHIIKDAKMVHRKLRKLGANKAEQLIMIMKKMRV